jgi:hypothetical protein
MRKADIMSQLPRIPRVLLLMCSTILLAGCQHPLAPSAGRQSAGINQARVNAKPQVEQAMYFPPRGVKGAPCVFDLCAPDSPDSKDETLIASNPKEPALTGQLGDALVLVLKTFTGR